MDADRKRFSTWHAHPRAFGFDQGIGDGQPVVSVSEHGNLGEHGPWIG